jgi:hypothetical protein
MSNVAQAGTRAGGVLAARWLAGGSLGRLPTLGVAGSVGSSQAATGTGWGLAVMTLGTRSAVSAVRSMPSATAYQA